ncbi:class I SAM-dependent methyltransferase [Spongisporangium articulatum]|uniref:Class I SAM-dependent methyltransferase n=1 Tax=Spongisporangium articulatum TaxID=3362603 RepID=A0ABW8ARD4_9ACTN
MTVLEAPTGTGVAAELAALAERLLGGPLPVGLKAWDGSRVDPVDPAAPTLVIASPDALRRLLWHPGELGLAQAYVTGELDVEGDLAAGFRTVRRLDARMPGPRELAALAPRLFGTVRRSGALSRLVALPPAPPDSQARLRGRLHSGRRDRAAIAHHYDLSNDFYALILDEHMAYSSAYFTEPDQSLEAAQAAKLALVVRKLGLQPGDTLLDVGCGWGSLSVFAGRLGLRVTGITLSQQQAEFARARVEREGLTGRVQIRLQDYRELESSAAVGCFDGVASLEMGEHVGQGNYPTYAGILGAMVRPGGRVLVQQMSRGLGAPNRHPGGGPFIEAYIAPDMFMRPVGETVAFLERAGLEVRDVHALREHYVRTVEHWYATFEQNWDRAVAMVGEEVARVWRLYLVGGGLAFEEGRMGVDQILAVRSGPHGFSGMPEVRTW